MKGAYQINGLFYEQSGYRFRKYLDIKRTTAERSFPDLMVIMMNPGSSSPLDGIDDSSQPVEAKPDKTQYQIMKVMEFASLNYARVLNLSDLRTPISGELYSFLQFYESADIAHSIFAEDRKADLNELFVKDVPVIFGWGVDPSLIPLAKQAVEALHIANPIGMRKPRSRYSYYHPLPPVYAKQQVWLRHVVSQLTHRSLDVE